MDIERIELTPGIVLGIHEVVSPDGLPEFFGRAFGKAAAALQEVGAEPAGPPIALYRGGPNPGFDVTAGIPIARSVTPPPGLELAELPAGQAITAIHVGSYESMERTYAEINDWMQRQNLTPAEPMWEEYLAGPDAHPNPADWRTRIVFPLAQELPNLG